MEKNMMRDRGLEHTSIKEFFSFSKIDLKKDFTGKKRILEIGCGNGLTSIDLKKFNPDLEIYCIDSREPDNLNEMKKLNIIFIQLDLKKIKAFPNILNNFDFIFSFRTFMHLDNLNKINTIEILANSLKENGLAFIDYTGNNEDNQRVYYKNEDDIILQRIYSSLSNFQLEISDIHHYSLDKSQFSQKEWKNHIKKNPKRKILLQNSSANTLL